MWSTNDIASKYVQRVRLCTMLLDKMKLYADMDDLAVDDVEESCKCILATCEDYVNTPTTGVLDYAGHRQTLHDAAEEILVDIEECGMDHEELAVILEERRAAATRAMRFWDSVTNREDILLTLIADRVIDIVVASRQPLYKNTALAEAYATYCRTAAAHCERIASASDDPAELAEDMAAEMYLDIIRTRYMQNKGLIDDEQELKLRDRLRRGSDGTKFFSADRKFFLNDGKELPKLLPESILSAFEPAVQ